MMEHKLPTESAPVVKLYSRIRDRLERRHYHAKGQSAESVLVSRKSTLMQTHTPGRVKRACTLL